MQFLLFFEITDAQQAKALPHLELGIVIGKLALVKGGLVPTLAHYDAASNILEDVPSVAVRILQRSFAYCHFVPAGKQRNSFVLVFGTKGSKSCR